MEQTQETDAANHEDQPALPAVNEVTVVGRLANTPRLNTFGDDKTRAQFIVAVPRPARGGQAKRGHDYLAVAAWRAVAKQCETLGKGDGVRVQGRMRTWQDETRRFHWEIEVDTLEVLAQRAAQSPRQEQLGV
jgi:single-stranded DNA-binding protein